MTAKEYLAQAYNLDRRINEEIRQAESLRQLAYGLGSPGFGERVQTSASKESPFTRSLDKVMDMESDIKDRIDLLVALREQVCEAINTVRDYDERIILHHRYLDGLTWQQIAGLQNVDRTTIYRWHNKALEHIVLPKNPIVI